MHQRYRRSPAPGHNSFNAMLNFGYQTMLFPEVWKAVSYAGLDFCAGYLHADRPGKPSLVLDMMEEFVKVGKPKRYEFKEKKDKVAYF